MTTYLSNRDGGKTNEEGHYRFHVKAWTGNVLSGLQAQAKSPLALGVDITTGDVKVDYSGYGYTAWTDALASVTLTTADPSNPRIDRVVGYIDRSVTPSSGVTNNPGILKFLSVAGTPAGSPSAPNDAAVQSAVGASNPWFPIANVLVGTGVTTISSGNITDTRVLVTVPTNGVVAASIKDGEVTTAKLPNAAVTPAKRSGGFKVGVIPASTFTSTGVKSITGVGFTPKLVRFAIMPTASTSIMSVGSGAMDGTSQYWTFASVNGGAMARESGATACIVVRSSGSNTPLVTAAYSAMGADGFSINVTTANASAFDVAYEAYA